jgi:hypothetical protein
MTVAAGELWRLSPPRTIAAISDETLRRPRLSHSLDQIAWQTVPADQPATLEYLIGDYIGHLQDHVRQILALTRQAAGDAP